MAKATRLRAETQDQRQLVMPDDLLAAAGKDPTIAALVQAEQNLFASRWDTFDGNARISGRKIEQMQSQVISLQAQIVFLNKRLALTAGRDTRQSNTCVRDGLEIKSQSLELRRSIAELEGAIGDAAGRLRRGRACDRADQAGTDQLSPKPAGPTRRRICRRPRR